MNKKTERTRKEERERGGGDEKGKREEGKERKREKEERGGRREKEMVTKPLIPMSHHIIFNSTRVNTGSCKTGLWESSLLSPPLPNSFLDPSLVS